MTAKGGGVRQGLLHQQQAETHTERGEDGREKEERRAYVNSHIPHTSTHILLCLFTFSHFNKHAHHYTHNSDVYSATAKQRYDRDRERKRKTGRPPFTHTHVRARPYLSPMPTRVHLIILKHTTDATAMDRQPIHTKKKRRRRRRACHPPPSLQQTSIPTHIHYRQQNTQ